MTTSNLYNNLLIGLKELCNVKLNDDYNFPITTLQQIKIILIVLFTGATTYEGKAQKPSRILVAYFSHSGNTRVIAGYIQRETGAGMFEIKPADDYPAEYQAVVDQAKKVQQISKNYVPILKC